MKTTAAIALGLALAGGVAAQDAPPTAEQLLQRFGRLDRDQRNTVVRNMERRLARLDDDVVQGVLGFDRGTADLGRPQPPAWFDPKEYAPVAAPRHLVAAGTAPHTAATAGMHGFEFLPDLHRAVVYDWGQGKVVPAGSPPADDARFANFVHGYLPGIDHAVARITAALDTDPEQRALAAYFEHLYADRDGAVFARVTLFDAWSSGKVVEVPDVDAIAFARHVLATRSFTAPIPADRRRERLYRKVREAFALHREYRSLRCAAAAAFAIADPNIDAAYVPLVSRCHWLWVQCGGDVARFAASLAQAESRAEWVQEIDAAIKASVEVVDGRRASLRAVAEYLRALADRELTAAGA